MLSGQSSSLSHLRAPVFLLALSLGAGILLGHMCRRPPILDWHCRKRVHSERSNPVLESSEGGLAHRSRRGYFAWMGSDRRTNLDAVQPTFAFISVGARNPFRHPRPEVLGRLAERHILTYRTDTMGALTFWLDGKSVRAATGQ
jgi:hypothetical protein